MWPESCSSLASLSPRAALIDSRGQLGSCGGRGHKATSPCLPPLFLCCTWLSWGGEGDPRRTCRKACFLSSIHTPAPAGVKGLNEIHLFSLQLIPPLDLSWVLSGWLHPHSTWGSLAQWASSTHPEPAAQPLLFPSALNLPPLLVHRGLWGHLLISVACSLRLIILHGELGWGCTCLVLDPALSFLLHMIWSPPESRKHLAGAPPPWSGLSPQPRSKANLGVFRMWTQIRMLPFLL